MCTLIVVKGAELIRFRGDIGIRLSSQNHFSNRFDR